MEVTVDPPVDRWRELAARGAGGTLAGEPIAAWQGRTRETLDLPVDRPIVATGHQTLLWHPGILAKYLAVEAVTPDGGGLGRANLVVDQHADDFAALVVPVRRDDGSLAVATVALTESRPGVPMGLHPAFDPRPPDAALEPALPCVARGLAAIAGAIRAHRDEPNAALQMAAALEDLMAPWVRRAPRVCASDLMRTELARALVRHMADDPARCAHAYNDAVAALPDVQIAPLAVTRAAVEVPLWTLGPGGRREHATDADARRWLEGDGSTLLPRALLLTALVRLGMCDLFVHGTGGASYDRAMEAWMRDWLGLTPAPIAVATATLRLPFDDGGATPGVERARHELRRLWHDPAGRPADRRSGPSRWKREALDRIAAAPRRSRVRQALFDRMHERLGALRGEHEAALGDAGRRLEIAVRRAAEADVRARRTWAFPLYAPAQIDELAARIGRGHGARVQCPP